MKYLTAFLGQLTGTIIAIILVFIVLIAIDDQGAVWLMSKINPNMLQE